MTEVNVEELRRNGEKSTLLSKLKKQNETNSIKDKVLKKNMKIELKPNRFSKSNNSMKKLLQGLKSRLPDRPQGYTEEATFTLRASGEDKEIKDTIKTNALFLLSRPIAADRREILHERLKNSKIINNYIDNNIFTKIIDGIGADMKFGLSLGHHYLQALK